MKEVIAVLVFCLVLFIYLHVFFHLKKCDDLEVYEICDPSKEKLEEICDIRQPVVTFFSNESLMENCNFNSIKTNYSAFDIRIRNVKDHDDETELYVPLGISESIELFKKDKDSKYLSERNSDFLEDSGLIKHYRHNDMFLRPSMVSSCMYDIIFASLNTETPLRYEVNYRNYFLVTHGKVIIIYIPAYWWYSIRFVKSNTSICSFKYKTYMNTLAISNHLFMRLLQRQNTKRVIAKKMDLKTNKLDSETVPILNDKDKGDIVPEVRIDVVSTPAPVAANDSEVTRIDL